MMSGRPQRGPTDWHRPQSTDRAAIGQQRVAELQRQIETLQMDQRERAALIHKLARLQAVEDEKRELQDRVLERHSRPSSKTSNPAASPRVLQSEMDRLYGRDSQLDNEIGKSPVMDRSIIDTVMQHRTKEFSAKQQEAALKAKYLDKERKRLQEARQRVQEQRRSLLGSVPPDDRSQSERGMTHPGGQAGRDGQFSLPTAKREPAQGVDTYIEKTVQGLPNTMNKIWKMREGIEQHYRYYQKPYNGELGVRSYEHWQVEDYFMCRDIVSDVVEDFLNLYFKHDDVVEKGTYQAMLEEDRQFRDRQADTLAEKKAVMLISEELMLDETSDMITEVIKEMHHIYGSFRNMTDTMFMMEAETVATGKDEERDPSDKIYQLVTKGYYSAKETRNSHRKEIWGHSQHALNKVKKRKINRKQGGVEEVEEVEGDEDEEEEEDEDAPDLTIIDFNTISPVQLKSLEPAPIDSPDVRQDKESFQRYLRRELEYWGKMECVITEYTFHKKCNGIRLMQPSPNHRFMAVGTYHGDLFVYDAWMTPWRPFRVLRYIMKKDAPIINICWSLDSTRIISINSLGALQVLSIIGGPVNPSDGKVLEMPADDKGIYPHELQPLLDLDVEREDFIFHQGIMAEENVQDDVGLAPQRAAFFPSLTFFGSQNDMIVSLDNGDILKCNFENNLKSGGENNEDEDTNIDAPKIYKPSLVVEEDAANTNTIGQNVEAELLRGHKKGILYMCFVELLNALITVDQRGNINKWKYNVKYKASFGWYIPSRKYKLETTKIMYKESGSDKPTVVFTDKVPPGKRPKSRTEVAAERRRVQNTLDNMQLGDPWHEEYLEEEEVILQVFAPRGVIADTGAMFHIVYKHEESDQLSTYITRLYKPVRVRCTRIVRVIGSPTGTELVVILLFNAYPPKAPHFTVFVVDLRTMEPRDFRKDIPLSLEEYNQMASKNIISVDVTRVFGPTGTDYLFLIFNGNLRCLSLTSGQPVAKMGKIKKEKPKRPLRPQGQDEDDEDDDEDDEDEDEDEDEEEEEEAKAVGEFKGCTINQKLLQVPPDSECSALSFEGKIYCVVYARKLAKMFVVSFEDKNVYAARRAMWKTYTTLQNHKVVPAELRVNSHVWGLDDVQHVAVAARRYLLKKMDLTMRKAGLIREHPRTIRKIKLSDKIENYYSLDKAVTNSLLLEKEGVNVKRAPSRAATATPDINEEDKF